MCTAANAITDSTPSASEQQLQAQVPQLAAASVPTPVALPEPATATGELCPPFTLTAKTSLFYAEGKERKGPFKVAEVAGLMSQGLVTGETRVWCKAMGNR